MKMHGIPFGTTDWSAIPSTEHAGTTGKAIWRTQNFGDIRVCIVEYTPGYLADHWCEKAIFCCASTVASIPSARTAASSS